MDYIIEDQFEHHGFICVCVMQKRGYRCGYVGVDTNNLLYGKNGSDYIYTGKTNIAKVIPHNELTEIDFYFDVHGGISYLRGGKRSDYPIKSDLWWFGFDCAHARDKYDFEAAKRAFAFDKEALEEIAESEANYRSYEGDEIRTLDYVRNECCKLADELSKFNV